MNITQASGEDLHPREREGVAARNVMKRKRTGEQARYKQALEDVVEPLAHIERGQLKRVGILSFLGEGERAVRPGAHD